MNRIREILDREHEQLRLLALSLIIFVLALTVMTLRQNRVRTQPAALHSSSHTNGIAVSADPALAARANRG